MCFAPVLDLDEAPQHPHNKERTTFIHLDGIDQPAPAPRFSRSATDLPQGSPPPGGDTDKVLAEAGFNSGEIAKLHETGVVASA